MSGRRTTRPRAAANAATRGGASRVAPATRSNRVPASGGGCSTTDCPSAGRSQGKGPTQERENETKTEMEQGLAAQERELGAVVESLATVLGGVNESSVLIRSPSTVFLTTRPCSRRSPTSFADFSLRTTVWSLAACSCSLV